MMAAIRIVVFFGLLMVAITGLQAQEIPMSQKMAQTAMIIWPDTLTTTKSGKPHEWNYEQGCVIEAIENVWKRTGEGKYFKYIQKSFDFYVEDDGNLKTYSLEEYNIDNITPGRALLTLYRETGKEKYKKAAYLIRKQLATHPRTKEGGFWHKKRYPYQMWLDGLYMAEPFYAEFAKTFNEPAAFDDIAKQIILMEKNALDPKTGLLYHAWDESRGQKWANPTNGQSPNFWGRAMGWYMMSLVDVLDYFPKTHPKRDTIIAILQRLSGVIVKYQDPKSGVWYQVLDKQNEKGNYLESSVSSMFVYSLAKGVRQGYIDKAYMAAAQKGYNGILKNFIETDEKGLVHLTGTCSVAGLGGDPYRDGSYAYYLSEKVVTDDQKGVAPFIFASVEMEIANEQVKGKGKKVGLDYYFNNEYKKDANGNLMRFHYTWEDSLNSGFSLWGSNFRDFGAITTRIDKAPTSKDLKDLDIYIIVDPDTPKETASPNYIGAGDIKTISEWVKAGGVLVLMANDSGNVELTHFNQLARQFGIEFNIESKNRVQGSQFEMGKIMIPANHPILRDVKEIYIKELATLKLTKAAQPILKRDNDVILAVARIGKGTVFAIGDPWLYNEYTDGKKLPAEYENFKAGKNLAAWLLEQAKKGK